MEAGKTVLEGGACAPGHHAVIWRLQVETGEGAEGQRREVLSLWVHPVHPQSWTQCPRTPAVCLWRPPRPAYLHSLPYILCCLWRSCPPRCASFPPADCSAQVDCEKGSESAGSHHLKTGPLSSHVSFVKRQVWTLFFCLFLAVPPQILKAGFCLDVWQRLEP